MGSFGSLPEPARSVLGDGVLGAQSPTLGRSRGGLTSKIRLVCDAGGHPLAFVLAGGNANGCTQFTTVMDAIRVPRPVVAGPGPGPITSSATRATARRRSASGCGTTTSGTPPPSGPTRCATGSARAAAAAALRPSTRRSTSTARSWNGASTALLIVSECRPKPSATSYRAPSAPSTVQATMGWVQPF